ncbi:MAG: hypothetical protein ACI8ZM_000555 [Crocinitomix sp.]|jgi:hypothetical protein
MIKIKYNCPESSAEMLETSCGKFCNSCQREVHDFRENSIEEIIQIKANNPSIKCGMFTSQQAVVDARTAVQNVFRMAFAAIFILGFNTTMLFGQTSQTVSDSSTTTIQSENKIIINGSVSDHIGFALKSQIKYSIGDEYFIIETNDEGIFEFELPIELIGKNILLQFYAEGYGDKYITTEALLAKCYQYNIRLGEKKGFSRKNRVLMGFF